jgi:putative intracellular protease/amidase
MKKVLFVASNYGLWAEELVSPWDAMRQAGFQTDLATYMGITPLPMAGSMDKTFIDPVQNIPTNPAAIVDRVNAILDSGEWSHCVKIADADITGYDALAMVGGPGAALDMTGNPALHRLILQAYKQGKVVGGLCYAVAAMCFTRDPDNHNYSILRDRTIVAHPAEWDFTTDLGYGLVRPSPTNRGTDLVTPGFVFPLQHMAEDAVGPKGRVITNPAATRDTPCVSVDGRIVTAQSVESSLGYGQAIIKLLGA